MRKSQTAVPAVLLTVMALMVWYLLWITPQQRYELLIGSNSPNEDFLESSIPYSYFYSKVGEIGQSSGTLLFSTTTSDMKASYPYVRLLEDNYEYQSLDATLFYSGSTKINLNKNYEMIEVELNSGETIGTPKIMVVINNTLYYENALFPNSKTSVKIPFTEFQSNGEEVEIICKFNGQSIFNSQKCVFDSINLYSFEYFEEKPTDSKTIYLNPTASFAEFLELSFNPKKFNENPIIMKFNGERIFQGSLNNQTTKLSIDLSNIELTDYANTLSVEASKGADYELSDIALDFYSLPLGKAERHLVFDLPVHAFGANNLNIYFNVTGIIEKGDLFFELLTHDANFIYPANKLVLGVNSLEVPINYFSENANNLKISSPNGRVVIESVRVYR